MYLFKYESSLGTLDLNQKDIILLKGHNFYNNSYETKLTLKNNGIGENLKRMMLKSKEYSFSLYLKGDDFIKNMEDLRKFFASDIEQLKPGRLYLNDSYIECYLIESDNPTPNQYRDGEILNLTVLALTPLWITEKEFNFSIHSEKTDIEGFKLPMRFPMHFVANSKQAIVENELSANTLSRIEFYGPVTDPTILIDDYPYSIKGTLLDNERYVIDQRDKTVVKITAEGDIVNSFHLRQKSPSVFEPIPKGDHIVNYDGTFSVRIVLFEGSVTPNWI